MQSSVLFLIALGTSGACACIVAAVLYRPLLRFIVDICGTEDRARFWTVYTSIMIVLSPMLALSFGSNVRNFDLDDPAFFQRCVFWSSLGLVAAMTIFGLVLWNTSSQLFLSLLRERESLARAAPKETA